MKNIVFGLLALSTTAMAGNLQIKNFSVIREGGGQLNAVVYQHAKGAVMYVKSCGFRDLTPAEQQKTAQFLVGATAQAASDILANRAVLASDQSISDPGLMTGTWAKLEVTFSYDDFNRTGVVETRSISKPLVLINSKVSAVLTTLEDEARKNSAGICE